MKKYSTKPRKYTTPKDSGYWLSKENIKKETLKVYSRFGRIPPTKELIELGYGSLHQHISKLDNDFLEKVDYFKFLAIYFSMAMVIDGVSSVGALISILSLALSAALTVVFP